jgi:outer membrane protein OmpA-like peptidoglycan-associated protein
LQEKSTGTDETSDSEDADSVKNGESDSALQEKSTGTDSDKEESDDFPNPEYANPCKGPIAADIKFELNSHKIREDSVESLNEYLTIFRNKYSKGVITVAGHACELGTNEYNLILSEKRAKTVKKYFEEHGIGSERLKIKAYGEERYDPAKGLRWNRRVEFICEECCKN